ncbi:unnamed protein product [Cuscuta epithymum]|uniref:superoxide dismutase n=1 Tax=Cuscuta epithymum TaxID=186058 RepID=A0AAV0ESW4_9ASTE|nr:unnamed protein product [Cuscuta epithymum]
MMAAVASTNPLSSAFFSRQGFLGSKYSNSSCRAHKAKFKRGGFQKIRAAFELKPPPYPMNALEPHMSRETFEYHWGKHHRAYVDKLNKHIVGTELDGMRLEDIVLATYNKGNMLPSFNNAAQAWNHEFFWESMKPGGGGEPSGELLELINRDFGSFDMFVKEFKTAAATQFGSGWAWLAYKANKLNVENAINPLPSEKDKKLVIVKTPNAVNPLVWDYSPLLTIDVWEHAYYLDFQNCRPDYISVFMEKLVSWEAVGSRLDAAKARVVEREVEEQKRRAEEEGQNDPKDTGVTVLYFDDDGKIFEADASEPEEAT